MHGRIGRLWPPPREGWLWIAGLVCIVLVVRFYSAPESEEVTEIITPTAVTATPTLSFTPVSASAVTRIPTSRLTASPTPTLTPLPVVHVVQAGEAPLNIADVYDIPVETLLAVNDIADPTLLQIGQELIIPVTVTPTAAASSVPMMKTASPLIAAQPVTYTIAAGDLLISLAARYSTTVEAIMIANNIDDPKTLQIGQQLLIPPHRGSPLGVPTVIHTIESGDTLLGLANLYGSSVDDILVTNPDLEPTLLQIGQRIMVPLTQPRADQAANPGQARITMPVPPSAALLALEQEMINGVNGQRQAQDLPAYIVDEQLTSSARAHAQDMVARGYFSHVTPEGKTLDDRLQEQGVQVTLSGENIQRNVQPIDNTVQYALNWFMTSRVHRQNILHPQHTSLGVGVAEGPPGWYTFVLVFAEK